jgi:hypothetical protein
MVKSHRTCIKDHSIPHLEQLLDRDSKDKFWSVKCENFSSPVLGDSRPNMEVSFLNISQI